MKIMDKTLIEIEEIMIERASKLNKMKPFLDHKLKEIQKIDNKLNWYQEKIKEIEKEKQKELDKMNDLLETAMVDTHKLSNGFGVKPDNKRKVEITNISDFLKWLKQNKTSSEVLSFFDDAIKLTKLKSFCEKESNEQRLKGIIQPKIDGVEFGDITFLRLTTFTSKEKKKCKKTMMKV